MDREKIQQNKNSKDLKSIIQSIEQRIFSHEMYLKNTAKKPNTKLDKNIKKLQHYIQCGRQPMRSAKEF